MTERVYLDWNATAPLCDPARHAMMAAMDLVGNPSSVHHEGRAARALMERARMQVAALVGAAPDEVVFTSGATEAAALAFAQATQVYPSPVEHDCVWAHGGDSRGVTGPNGARDQVFSVGRDGAIGRGPANDIPMDDGNGAQLFAVQAANSETGIIQNEQNIPPAAMVCDAVQAVFRIERDWMGRADRMLISGHKFGGPKGVGALILRAGAAVPGLLPGGGQEMGRRSGTENLVGIAGFGAAAETARRDLEDGVWDRVKELRTILESELDRIAPEATIIGRDSPRLPNTTCVALPGWKGETQVMQMDLAGFAISAGSACSSGKVKESRVLRAMGFDAETAGSAIRVSLGPATTEDEILRFAQAWGTAYHRHRKRAA